MYVILVYDIDVERLNRIRKYCRTFLPRVQNSVFEGEITEAKLARLKSGLAQRIDTKRDSVLIWVLRDAKWADRQVIGNEPHPVSNVI